MPAPKADFCAVAATASDGSSAQIYLFGGSLEGYVDAGVDVHVLTIPYFRWIKVAMDSVPGGFRKGHSCLTYNDRQMLVIGGTTGHDFISPKTPDDAPPQGTQCAKGKMSISSFDMSTLKFLEGTFDPSLNTYDVPQAVIAQIGGDKQGKAKKTSPRQAGQIKILQLFLPQRPRLSTTLRVLALVATLPPPPSQKALLQIRAP
ncbi:hypothetical protein K440DRAFT_403748 [Wilcoxina mikolae CBS 423.85]|nr:hypothetical protein K440DRAFT_403748 [Wilcoxina mikolae CBS 423.85]